MLKRKSYWLLAGLVVLAMVLAACGTEAPADVLVDDPAGEGVGEAVEDEQHEEADPSVSVSAQDISAGTVIIEDVISSQPCWIVIHVTRDGSPGPVIGFAPVDEGENRDVTVEVDLDQATGQLFAMLHLDAGTMGTYEFPGDDVPVKVGDAVVNVPFEATFAVEPQVSVSDQDFSSGIVTLENVAYDAPGWLVIHVENEGTPGLVIGFAPVAAGNNTGLQVEIDAGAATSKLFAMLHLDAGTLGEYEFPGDDVPVRIGDAVVVVPFSMLEAAAKKHTDKRVTIEDSSFNVKELTVPVGTTIKWKMGASLPHTVTADDGTFESGTLRNGDSFSFTFDTPGTYPYYCRFHGGPGGSGMSGVVTVTG